MVFLLSLGVGFEIVFFVSWMRAVTSSTLQSVVFSLLFFSFLSFLKPFYKILTAAGSTHWLKLKLDIQ